MKWNEQRVLITGASRGLGAATAQHLSSLGARLILVARSEEALREVKSRLPGTAFTITADLTKKDDIHRISGEAAALLGGIDVIIHNAGTLGPVPLKNVLDTDCEDLELALATNVVGPFRLTKALAGPMVLRKQGTLVFVSSDDPTWGAYGASKAAMDQLAKILGAEEPSLKILRFDPGEMDTQMHEDAMPEAEKSTLKRPDQAARELINAIERG